MARLRKGTRAGPLIEPPTAGPITPTRSWERPGSSRQICTRKMPQESEKGTRSRISSCRRIREIEAYDGWGRSGWENQCRPPAEPQCHRTTVPFLSTSLRFRATGLIGAYYARVQEFLLGSSSCSLPCRRWTQGATGTVRFL